MIETNTRTSKAELEIFLESILRIKQKFEVTRVSFINGFAETRLPVAIAYRPNSKVLAQSGGKGISRTQTMISALMESFECNTAENVNWDVVEAYGSGRENLANPLKLSTTLRDYNNSEKIRWCKAENLYTGSEIYIPFAAVTLDFREMSYIHKREPMMLTSNGLASGKNWDDATISAIYEVIERHSITTNEMNKSDKERKIDKSTLKSEALKDLIKKAEENDNLSVEIYDNTIWSEFPTYKSVLSDGHMIWSGFGTHSDPIVAATRAVTEANQARIISISGSREDMNKNIYLLSAEIQGSSKSGEEMGKGCEIREYGGREKNPSLDEVKKILLKITPNVYIYRYEQKVENVCVVRVVAEELHSYNYLGYSRMTVLETIDKREDSLMSREQHSPAAG